MKKVLMSLIGAILFLTIPGSINLAFSYVAVADWQYDGINPDSACTTGDSYYTTIQLAVDATDGGTIIVCPGTYTENVTVYCDLDTIKSLSITSFSGNPSDTIIKANGGDVVSLIHHPDCYWAGIPGSSISGFTITGGNVGIYAYCAMYGSISNNYITGNYYGIYLTVPRWTVEKNDIISNTVGIELYLDNNNTIKENNIVSNNLGIKLFDTHSNTIYHNNIIDNTNQADEGCSQYCGGNNWHDPTLLEGNYWSDYTGVDDGSGGRIADDCIGDTLIPWPSVGMDYYPLMNPPVRIAGATPTYYSTLQHAYISALDGDIIQSRAIIFPEDLNINQNISVTLEGGYNCDYTTTADKTILNGTMNINDGMVTIENFAIE